MKICLKIKGMHCEGCSRRLEKVLNAQNGVKDSRVSLEEEKSDIEYDENLISVEELKEVVEDAGFDLE